MGDRGIWGFKSTDDWDDTSIAITSTPDGLLVAVTEEQAVDSYNDTFTCSVTIPPAQVREFIQFLANHGWNDAPEDASVKT